MMLELFLCSKRKLNKNKQTKILVHMHFVVLSNFSSLDPMSSISWLVLQQFTTQKMKVKGETFTFLQNKLSQPRLEFLKGGLLRSARLLPTPLLPSPLVLCSSLPPGSSSPANASQLELNLKDTSMGTPTSPQALWFQGERQTGAPLRDSATRYVQSRALPSYGSSTITLTASRIISWRQWRRRHCVW